MDSIYFYIIYLFLFAHILIKTIYRRNDKNVRYFYDNSDIVKPKISPIFLILKCIFCQAVSYVVKMQILKTDGS